MSHEEQCFQPGWDRKEAKEKAEGEVKDLKCELKDQELAWTLKCGTGTWDTDTEGAGGQHGL